MAGLGRFARAVAPALGLSAENIAVEVVRADGMPWRSHLPVAELALDAVAVSSAVLERVAAERGGRLPAPIRIDAPAVAASFGSERVLRVGGVAPEVWAPLSGFWRAGDGWVRTHGNYPHHAARLAALLGVEESRDAVAAAIARRGTRELEDSAARAGAIVAAVRDGAEWTTHPQSLALAGAPLVGLRERAAAAPRPWRDGGEGPLAGVRVLDLTRVIAGPVATRDLALAGADVLRVDSPRLPEPLWQLQDTGQDKRAALLDLEVPADRGMLDALLDSADVVVTGYRPGALDRFGLAPEELVAAHPGIVVATLSAWGRVGPWARRRGFDSIVQATIGIAVREAVSAERPGALPAQALDHATGHLLAAAIAEALRRQRRSGGTWHVDAALARTGAALLAAPGQTAGPADAPLPTTTVGRGATALVCAPPVLGFSGAPARYRRVPVWGGDAAAWASDVSPSGPDRSGRP